MPRSLQVLLTVGNSLKGDDGAGPLLAALCEEHPVPGWEVVDGGVAPENVLHRVRALRPQLVLMVDAADLQLSPGEVRFVSRERLSGISLFSTHHLPMSLLMDTLDSDVEEVLFLGIQPTSMDFGCPISPEVQMTVHRIHAGLASGLQDVPWVE